LSPVRDDRILTTVTTNALRKFDPAPWALTENRTTLTFDSRNRQLSLFDHEVPSHNVWPRDRAHWLHLAKPMFVAARDRQSVGAIDWTSSKSPSKSTEER
jgi:hypothetical protein